MEKSNLDTIKKKATSLGIMLGVILSLITALMYATNPILFTKWWIGVLSFLLVLVFGIISTSKSKGVLNGFISFKEAFTSYFITVALGALISTLVGILIFAVIDPETAIFIKERTIEITVEFMERFNTPETEIQKTVDAMKEQDNLSALGQLKSYVFQLLFYSLIGLLVALVFKRKDPNAIDG